MPALQFPARLQWIKSLLSLCQQESPCSVGFQPAHSADLHTTCSAYVRIAGCVRNLMDNCALFLHFFAYSRYLWRDVSNVATVLRQNTQPAPSRSGLRCGRSEPRA